jgi:hypothetical protein
LTARPRVLCRLVIVKGAAAKPDVADMRAANGRTAGELRALAANLRAQADAAEVAADALARPLGRKRLAGAVTRARAARST